MAYRIPITEVHIQGKQWSAVDQKGYLEIVPLGNSLLIRIVELKNFNDKAGNKATIDIVVEDELLSFKAPAEDQLDDAVFSFKVAIVRPTTWVDAVFSDIDPEHAVMFQCDVLCDTNDMSDAQMETLVNFLPEIQIIMTSTLASDAVTQYPKGRGVDLWQEELDVWGMIDNDRRCYEMCIRSTLSQEGTAILWDPVKLDLISSLSRYEQGNASRVAISNIRKKLQGLVDFGKERFHFLPQYEEEVWSMIVISNLNATLQDRQDGTGYQQFLMPQQPHTIESQEFVIKFLKVCTNSEKVAHVPLEIIR
ncbi:hypothetical protein FIBSPDRAFT_905969, partial [Athelia psychrophila]